MFELDTMFDYFATALDSEKPQIRRIWKIMENAFALGRWGYVDVDHMMKWYRKLMLLALASETFKREKTTFYSALFS